jgi:hypothetical protein
MVMMGEQNSSTVESANLLRILPIDDGFFNLQKLNPCSQRLLNVVGSGTDNKLISGRRKTMFENNFCKPINFFRERGHSMFGLALAQVLDITLATAETLCGDHRAWIELGNRA